jgi:hypothetical protein
MQRNILNIAVLFLLAACTSGSTPKGELVPQKKHDDWKKLEQNGYSIQYPADWRLENTGQGNTVFFLFAPSQGAQDSFKENINLTMESLRGNNVSLEKFNELSLQKLKAEVVNFAVVESKKLENADGSFWRSVFTGDLNGYHFQFEQYYFLKNDNAYVLTFVSEVNEFKTYRTTAEDIMNSFSIQ